jgi:hypothetical protein
MDSSFDYPKINQKPNKKRNRNEVDNNDEEAQRISFSCRYFCSITGLLRLAIIVIEYNYFKIEFCFFFN